MNNFTYNNQIEQAEKQIPTMITVLELQKLLDIGRDTAYNLVRRKDFPSIKLGKEYRIFSDRLSEWLIKQQKNK